MEAVLKISKSAIYSAILNLGISFFKLEILEYCGGRRSHPTHQRQLAESSFILTAWCQNTIS